MAENWQFHGRDAPARVSQTVAGDHHNVTSGRRIVVLEAELSDDRTPGNRQITDNTQLDRLAGLSLMFPFCSGLGTFRSALWPVTLN